MTEEASRTHGIDRLSPILTKLYRYWCDKAGERPYPSRRDLDPVDIPSLLSDLMLVEIASDGRYRYRLAGTRIERIVGMQLVGRYVDDVMINQYREYVLEIYDTVLRTERPHYSVVEFLNDKQLVKKIAERMVLPLGDGSVTMFIVGQIMHYTRESLPSALQDYDTLNYAKPIPLHCPNQTKYCSIGGCLFGFDNVFKHDLAEIASIAHSPLRRYTND